MRVLGPAGGGTGRWGVRARAVSVAACGANSPSGGVLEPGGFPRPAESRTAPHGTEPP